MDIEIFTLCDYSQSQLGKLTVVGAFDTLNANMVPVILPECHIAVRIRYRNSESGKHSFGISVLNPDGKPVIPPLKDGFKIPEYSGRDSGIHHINVGFSGIKFDSIGRYSVILTIDGQEIRTLPFYIVQAQIKKAA